ncbi:MAG TPA: hypothetical protein VFR23_08120 [Jiangellaceae bacterium]|nr:hypothetical protein [Jiangellaceae bacterium]
MDRAAARARLSMPGAIFAFLTAVVLTVFGAMPSTAAPARQPTGSGDAAAATAGGTDAGAAVSVAAPDDTTEDFQLPGQVAGPAAELPETRVQCATAPAPPTGHVGTDSADTTRGRAPPQ